MRRRSIALAAALSTVTVFGCKDDSTSGPSVSFPNLPDALIAGYCIQGNRTPGQSISGSVATTDCPLGDGSYFETWRVRVATTGSHRIAASSTFDNVLFLLRLDSYTSTSAQVTTIAVNDDTDGTNAVIAAATLQAGTDYFIVVNGFGATDTGPYSVTFTRN